METFSNISSCLFANPLCPKSIFWTNLVLLGFNPSDHATGSYSAIVFNKDVFTKGPSSVKAMELIVWFLFNELDSTLTKDKFFECWPVTTAANAIKFRSIAYKWLEQLKKEGCLGYTDIILRKSAFDECQGERFERVIMAFSSYVVKVLLDREYQNYCQASPVNFKILRESAPDLLTVILKIHIKIQTDKFITETQERLVCQEHWKNLANILTERLYNITERSNQLEKEISEFYKGKLFLETFDNLSMEQLSSIRLQKLENARSTWNLFLSWIGNNQNFTGSVEDIIYDCANKYRLDGQGLLLEVPEIMMTIWENIFQKEQINPYQGGKKDLKSLLKLWRFSLQTLIKHLQTQGLSNNIIDKLEIEDLSCTLNELGGYLSVQQEQAKSLSSLKSLLRNRLDEINKSIKSFREDHRSLTFAGYNKDTEGRKMVVMLKVPSFNFIYANQTGDDKEMVELQLGHEFASTLKINAKRDDNKLQNTVISKSIDMERGQKLTSKSLLNMTKLSSSAKSPVSQMCLESGKDLRRFTSSNIPRSSRFQFTKSPATPYDILANDIVNHVASEEDSPLTNSPPHCVKDDFDKIHSIRDPLNAMGEEVFKPKKEIVRSPRNSNLTPQTKIIKSALKQTVSRVTSIRSVKFADTELETPMAKIAPLMDETPPGMIDKSGYSAYNEWG